MRRLFALGSVLAVVLASALALSGCATIAQKATQAAVEKTTGVKVEDDGGTITTTDKDGNKAQLSTGQGTYPDGFPGDFPKYDGTIDSAIKGSSGGKDSFSVVIMTADAPKDVYAFYVAELEKNGWKIEQKMDGTTSETAFATIACSKDDLTGGVTLSRSKGDPQTSIAVALGTK